MFAYGLGLALEIQRRTGYSFPRREKVPFEGVSRELRRLGLSYTCDVDKLGQRYAVNPASICASLNQAARSDLVTTGASAQIVVILRVAQLTLCSLFLSVCQTNM